MGEKGGSWRSRFAHSFHWGSNFSYFQTLGTPGSPADHLIRLPEQDDRIIVQLEQPLFADGIRAFVLVGSATLQPGKRCRRRSSSRLLFFCITGDRKFLLSANCDCLFVLIFITLALTLRMIVLFVVLVLVVTLENDLLLDDGFLTGMTLSPQPASV